jgi:8-oxo-dGTP diphosphatase
MVAVKHVHAAGGVPWRGSEVALVYRPRYGDWTLPKGKLEKHEHPLVAAVREVREETGLTCVPQVRLPTIRYLTGEPNVEKVVDFWSMRVCADAGREPDDEIAEVRWVPLAEAPGRLSYKHDRGVLAAFAKLPRITAEIALVRHVYAGTKHAWHGNDRLRPVDSVGHGQAAQLAAVLEVMAPDRVVSASPQRCRETVLPLAEKFGLSVKVDPAFDEDSPAGVPGAVEALRALAAEGGSAVVCSQGKVIPPLLRELRPAGTGKAEDFETPKGAGWLLGVAGTTVVGADRLEP